MNLRFRHTYGKNLSRLVAPDWEGYGDPFQIIAGGVVMDGWWSEIDRDVRAILEGSGPMSPRDIARQLRLSEGAVASVLAMLVQEGKLSIKQVEMPSSDDGRQLSL